MQPKLILMCMCMCDFVCEALDFFLALACLQKEVFESSEGRQLQRSDDINPEAVSCARKCVPGVCARACVCV